jgi:hypothetical protein
MSLLATLGEQGLARKATLTNYVRELKILLCRKINERSRLLYRRVEDKPITKMIINKYTGEYQMARDTSIFLPRFTCLPAHYVPVVSTNTWCFGG